METVRPECYRVIILGVRKEFTVASNTDINTLRTVGNYICTSSSITATLTNKPTGLGNAFRMEVWGVPYSPDYVIQKICENAKGYIFYRASTGGTAWGPWYKFEGAAA